MKGAILDSGMEKYTSLDIFSPIIRKELLSYNWLLTNIDSDYQSENLKQKDYEFMTGDIFLRLIEQNDFTFVWGVFSAFPKEIELDRIISEGLPFADGYTGFWKLPINIQNPLAITEIVFWDGMLNLIISHDNEIVDTFLRLYDCGKDLEEYNRELLMKL
jgi:hypothetical protein